MRKINKFIYLLFIISIFFSNISVFAKDYSINELIPVTEEATVITNTFVYNGIKFTNDKNNKINGMIRFQSISNNTSSKISPSIGILLFDVNMKNIGYINYCASKDYDSDNSHIQISGNGNIPFELIVSPRYLGANENNFKGKVYDTSEIAYYAVHDDNKYCRVGGYVNYYGYTLEEITGDKVFKEEMNFSDLILYLPYFLIVLVAFIGYGLLLNMVYKRMYARTSILSYLPLTNLYIAVKLAFGRMIGWIFYILFIVSLFIAYKSSDLTFTWGLLIFVGVSTLIDLIKLITGKYDMFVIGKKHKKIDDLNENYSSNSGSRFIGDSEVNKDDEQPLTANDILNNINNGLDNEIDSNEMNIETNDVVDISYDCDVPVVEDLNSNDVSELNNIENNSQLNDANNNLLNDSESNDVLVPVSNVLSSDTLDENSSELSNVFNTDNNNSIPKLGEDEVSGESELSNFFK